MGEVRQAIIEDRFPVFVKEFFAKLYGKKGNPQWAIDALKGVNIEI